VRASHDRLRLAAFQGIARARSIKIAELAYVIVPINGVDSKITENRSVIPLSLPIFTPKARNSGSLCRYIQECSEIRDNSGIQYRYYVKCVDRASSKGLQEA
jgi:hypothetical protein